MRRKKVLILALIPALGIAYAGYLVDSRKTPAATAPPPSLEGVASIYRQLQHTGNGVSLPRSGKLLDASAERIFGGQFEFRRLQDAELSQGKHEAEPSQQVVAGSRSQLSSVGRQTLLRDASALNTPAGGGFLSSAALVFQSSFSSLFASLFDTAARDRMNPVAELLRDEDRNPFSEARGKDEMQHSADALASAKAAAIGREEAPETRSEAPNKQAPAAAAAGVAAQPDSLLLVGDFDGSGTLQFRDARRVGETVFATADSLWNFNLFVNGSAVEGERSFTIEDINGDGIADLLVTSRASLFGGILLGNDSGEFHVADVFFTGYATAVTAVGPMRDGGREIVSVNLRSGATSTFRPQGRYVHYRSGNLEFLPDYVSRLLKQTGGDYLLASRTGNQPRLYSWQPDSRLEGSPETVDGGPSLHLAGENRAQNIIGSVQVFQVGHQASIVLANKNGQVYNVANLRVTPQIFLIIGDLDRRGSLDVAVAYLLATQLK